MSLEEQKGVALPGAPMMSKHYKPKYQPPSSSRCWSAARMKPCSTSVSACKDKWVGFDDCDSELALDGYEESKSSSCIPGSLLHIVRHHKEKTANAFSTCSSNNRARHGQEGSVPALTRISPTSSSDQDMPPMNERTGLRIATRRGDGAALATVKKSPAMPLYHSPEATSIPLPHGSAFGYDPTSSSPDSDSTSTSLFCSKSTKLMQRALRRKSDPPSTQVKKVDPRTLQFSSYPDVGSLYDDDISSKDTEDDVTIPHRNNSPAKWDNCQVRLNMGNSPVAQQANGPTGRTSSSQFHAKPTLPADQYHQQASRNTPGLGQYYGPEPSIWRPLLVVQGASGEEVVALSNPPSFGTPVYADDDEPELSCHYRHQMQCVNRTNAGKSLRGGQLKKSNNRSELPAAVTLTPDMLKEHEKRGVAAPIGATYIKDPLARDVIRKKERYEKVKEQQKCHHSNKNAKNSNGKTYSMSNLLPAMKKQAEKKLKKMTSTKKKTDVSASENALQYYSWDDGASHKLEVLGKEPRSTASTSDHTVGDHNWVEWERQEVLSTKWQQKKQERIVRDRMEQMRLEESERQKSREHFKKSPPRRKVSF